MKMNNQQIYLNLVEFFVKIHGYALVAVNNGGADTWLINKTHQKYPLIRISIADAYLQDETYLQEVVTSIRQLVGIDSRIFDIYITNNSIDFQDDLREAVSFNQQTLQNDARFRTFKEIETIFSKPRQGKRYYKNKYVRQLMDMKVTTIVTVICAIMFLFEILLMQNYAEGPVIVFLGAIYKHMIYGGLEWWRLLTAGFLHGSFQHLFFNLLALSSVGRMCEQIYGSKKTLAILLFSIIIGSWAGLITTGPKVVTLGLSGGIYGLLAADILYLFQTKLIFVRTIGSQIMRMMIINILISFLPGVSLAGHLGGFIGGLLLSLYFSYPKREKQTRFSILASLAIIIAGLGFYSYHYDQHSEVVINNVAIGGEVVKIARDLHLDLYADQLEHRLTEYFETKDWSWE